MFLGLYSKHFADLAVSTTLQQEQRLAGARMATEQVSRCTQQGPWHTEPLRMLWKDAKMLVTLAGVPEHLESALHMERNHAGHASQERFCFWLIGCYESRPLPHAAMLREPQPQTPFSLV